MLLLAQGNALGGAYALINTFGILAVQPPKCHAPLARNLVRDYFLFVTRFLRVAFLSRRLKNAECVNRGVRYPGRCPGLWATFGLCIMSAALGNTSKLYCPRLRDISARLNHLPSFARHFSPPQSFAFSYEIASKLWRFAKRPDFHTLEKLRSRSKFFLPP